MATRTISPLGGNWNNTLTWVEGVVPTSSDDIVATAASGNLTLNTTANCKTADFTNWTGTLTHNSGIIFSVYGNKFKFVSGMNYTAGNNSSGIQFINSTTDTQFWSGGKNIRYVYLNTSTKTLQLQDDITGLFQWVQNSGTLDPNGKTVTFNAGGAMTMSGNATFYNLVVSGSAVKTDSLTLNNNLIIDSSLNLSGNSPTNRILITSNTLGTPRTITLGASATFKTSSGNFDLRDITVTGGAANERDFTSGATGTVGDCQGNSGVTFTPSINCYWKHGSNASYNWSDSSRWFLSDMSTGARVPLPQDDVYFGGTNSFPSTGKTISGDMPILGRNIDWTGTTNNPTFTATSGNISCYGNLTLISGMSYSNTGNLQLSGRGDQTLTTAGKYNASIIIQTTGTYIAQDNISCFEFYIYGGTFKLANNNMSLSSLNVPSTNTGLAKNLYLGNGTWSFTGSTSALTMIGLQNSGTDLTIYPENSTFIIDTGNNNISIAAYSKQFNNIYVSPNGSGTLSFTYSLTVKNLEMYSAGTKTIKFTKNLTYYVKNNFFQGTNNNLVTITSDDGVGTYQIFKESGNIDTNYLDISCCSAAGGAAPFYVGTNSISTSGKTSNLIFATRPAAPNPPSPDTTNLVVKRNTGIWTNQPVAGTQLRKDNHWSTQGLIGCWPMNEGSGSVVRDYSGNNAHGSGLFMGASYLPTWKGGKSGTSLNFSGTNRGIYIPYNSKLLTEKMSICILAKNSSWTTQTKALFYLSNDSVYNNKIGFIIYPNNYMKFDIYTSLGLNRQDNSTSSLSSGWHFIVGTYDGYIQKFYIDGRLVNSTTISSSYTPLLWSGNQIPGCIGNYVSNTSSLTANSWGDSIECVSIYNRALSAQEVAQLSTNPYMMLQKPVTYVTMLSVVKMYFKIDGVIKSDNGIWVKIDGVWKSVVEVYAKIDGSWKLGIS